MTDTIAVAEAIQNGEHDACLRDIGTAVSYRIAQLDPTEALHELALLSLSVDEYAPQASKQRMDAAVDIIGRLRQKRFHEHASALVRDFHRLVQRKVMAVLVNDATELGADESDQWYRTRVDAGPDDSPKGD